MQLTVNRRLVFAASRRLARDGCSRSEEERLYGPGRQGRWGSGENFEAHFVFKGDVSRDTGMFVNLATVKEALAGFIEPRYDHRFLNLDTPPFDTVPPTTENLARQMFTEADAATRHLAARLVACRVADAVGSGSTAYASGRIEREFSLAFSAARRTWSPHLSDAENETMFGRAAAPAGHGHGYRLRVTLSGEIDEDGVLVAHERSSRALAALHQLLDHRHLNVEVPELSGEPMTTEGLARFIFHRLAADLPVARVELHETPEFFAEFDGSGVSLGLQRSFSAAHTLRNPRFSDEENRRAFGRCSNPNGHGHRYFVQATVGGRFDERTGTAFNLARFEAALDETLGAWDGRHLDFEVEDFRDTPSTGENILSILWPRLNVALDWRLVRLRLHETENNRFTLRARRWTS